jgi:hypothetical protein
MKKNYINLRAFPMQVRHIIFCLFTLLSCAVSAQDRVPLPCGPSVIDTAAFGKALRFEAANTANTLRSGSNYQVRVYFHIFRNSDGTNAAATVAQIAAEFNTLGYDYSLGNICFLNCGYNFVDNTTLNTQFNASTQSFSLFDSYLVPSCINIFYLQAIGGTNSSCSTNCGFGGITPSIPSNFTFIATSNIGGGQTISHEVGHCLGLIHTFGNSGAAFEDINGSNSTTAGDLIQDTHADPWAFNQSGSSCYSQSGGVYNGTCTDPNGQSNYSPPYTNLMAYWWSVGGYSPLVITADQFTRVNSFLSSNSSLESCESSTSNVTISPTSISSGYDFVSSFDNLTSTSGSTYSFSGSATAAFFGTNVTLNPGFVAVPGSSGSVLISPDNCSFSVSFGSPAPGTSSFTTGLTTQSDANSEIKIVPNPFNSSFELSIIAGEEEKASIIIYNALGARVKEVTQRDLAAGSNLLTFDCNELASGVYLVEIRAGETVTVKKIVKSS